MKKISLILLLVGISVSTFASAKGSNLTKSSIFIYSAKTKQNFAKKAELSTNVFVLTCNNIVTITGPDLSMYDYLKLWVALETALCFDPLANDE